VGGNPKPEAFRKLVGRLVGFNSVVTLNDPALHKARRSTLTKGLTRKALECTVPYIIRESEEMAASWIKKEVNHDTGYNVNEISFLVIIYMVFGNKAMLPESKAIRDAGLKAQIELSRIAGGALTTWDATKALFDGRLSQATKTVANMIDYFVQMAKRDDPGPQFFIHHLLNSDMDPGALEDDLKLILFAGVDTTANTVNGALAELGQKPQLQEELYQEVEQSQKQDLSDCKLLQAVWRESLRIHSPVFSWQQKELVEDITVGPYTVPKGCIVGYIFPLNFRKGMKDPHVWRPKRWIEEAELMKSDKVFIAPFSKGKADCVGRPLAELEGPLLIGTLILNAQIETVEVGTPVIQITRHLKGTVLKVKKR
jgi:cytochrome P450